MPTHNTAEETLERFGDTVSGKAKEFAGAVTGNDELTEEGRLRQEEARAQRDAATEEAQADARQIEADSQEYGAIASEDVAHLETDVEAAADKAQIEEERRVSR